MLSNTASASSAGTEAGGGTSVHHSITVAVRVRPLLPKERMEMNDPTFSYSSGGTDNNTAFKRLVQVLDSRVLIFDPKDPTARSIRTYDHRSRRNKEIRYSFDRVFSEEASQQEVYEGTVQPLIDSVLQGYNATVFAYGATGCGKTHTITGTPSDPGVISRTMEELFRCIEQRSKTHIIESTVSYLEVYNETIRDLLIPEGPPLHLREDESENHVLVSGLSEHHPKNVNDVMKMLILGNENRTRAPTEANAVSSRSHAVLQIRIRTREKVTGVTAVWKSATLSIIDLAGSERASATKNKGDRQLEGANINRSLLALGNCINALCSNKPNHIPYRDSKLTRLLKYSLGGNCKVVMIANISPAVVHYDETQNTLKYANRAKNITTVVAQNNIDVEYHISEYPKIIRDLNLQILELKEEIAHRDRQVSAKASAGKAAEGNRSTRSRSLPNESSEESSAFGHDLIRQVHQLFYKLDEKRLELTAAMVSIERNEHRLKSLQILADKLSSMCTNSESVGLAEELLSRLQLSLLSVCEELHLNSANLRQYTIQAEEAIKAGRNELSNLQNGAIWQKLSQVDRENVKKEIMLMEVMSENSQLTLKLEVLRGIATERTTAVDKLSASQLAAIQGLEEMAQIAHSHNDEMLMAMPEDMMANVAGVIAEVVSLQDDQETSLLIDEVLDRQNKRIEHAKAPAKKHRRSTMLESRLRALMVSDLQDPEPKPDSAGGDATAAIKSSIENHFSSYSSSADEHASFKRSASDQMECDNDETPTAPKKRRIAAHEPDGMADADSDATPVASHRRDAPANPPATKTPTNAGHRVAALAAASASSGGGPIRSSPMRRTTRNRARESLIPVMVAPGSAKRKPKAPGPAAWSTQLGPQPIGTAALATQMPAPSATMFTFEAKASAPPPSSIPFGAAQLGAGSMSNIGAQLSIRPADSTFDPRSTMMPPPWGGAPMTLTTSDSAATQRRPLRRKTNAGLDPKIEAAVDCIQTRTRSKGTAGAGMEGISEPESGLGGKIGGHVARRSLLPAPRDMGRVGTRSSARLRANNRL
ncbi:P-loop containing nucleoside triphosphate hydrolase protein [Polychytrium aggregatum]|uniref:P-loop containing nucleoside triphosphate hydrolase protein n=1 Tax=Polychytrium aggregatum TaxID=110093 RepID=UPI0022FF28F9|nr:P-loop containing nucleoside triphosphate hydrolase protein [Polychytrium aggregatum]KAI9208256.1 P-loop containing nucleoside triphosphate hydrolase protein [Polychytrium aggregatum]